MKTARRNEDRAAGPVPQSLELTRTLAGSPIHDDPVALPEDLDQLVGGTRDSRHMRGIGHDAVCTQDVVGILGTLRRNDIVEHDSRRFVERELGALDVVAEVSLVERK
jgi:hypothetical protein